MFSNETLAALLAFVFSTGAVIAILLERIPGWENLSPNVKKAIVGVVNVLAPVVLIVLKAYIPPDVLNQTGAQLLAGVASMAVAFIAHQIDLFLQGLGAAAKVKIAAA